MVRLFHRLFSARQLPGGLLFALLCAAMAGAGSVEATTLTVTSTADSGAGSLRDAIAAASNGDTIQFDAALNGQTITLTSAELVIDKNVTISGPGPNLLAVTANSSQFRIFHVMSGHTVTIGGLTISGGVATGGGVLNDQATLTLDNCTVSGNRGGLSVSGTLAGGIFNGGTMTITGSTVSFNVANVAGGIDNFGTLAIRNTIVSNNRSNFYNQPPSGGSAGGIENENVGTLEISSSTISNNWADVWGGGIINYGMMTVTDSTVSGNVAAGMFGTGTGGGIFNGGSHAEIHNSTVSSNLVNGDGGGINSARPLTITNSTISDNRASQNGGGIFNVGSNATLEIGDTILKASAFGTNIFNSGGTVTSRGYNVSSDSGGGFLNATGDQINTNPMLGPLQYNGGPTFTHGLLTGSPAIDAGDPNFTPPPLYDQRGPGWDRVFNGRIDIGSLEVQPVTPTPIPTPTPTPTPTATATPPATATPTPTPTATATPPATPTPSPSPTATPPATPTPTPTPTATATPPATPTPSPSPTATPSPTAAQALNISTRLRVQTGNNVLIGGFIITGNAPKNVAVRGIGPSLAAFGISDALADPTLELRASNGALLFQNDNWRDNPAQAAELTALGLALQDPRESGIVATLQPGASYTAILAGKNGGTGVGLVEIYDTNRVADSQLANISTRGFVQTGNNVMIGGFILGGNNGSTRVAVRGIGPSLSQSGLSNVLADPTLELRDSNGLLLIANDNWQDDPVSAAQLTAHGLALQDPLESGIFASLPPGAFTAILAGKNGGTGIGLVEIYNVH